MAPHLNTKFAVTREKYEALPRVGFPFGFFSRPYTKQSSASVAIWPSRQALIVGPTRVRTRSLPLAVLRWSLYQLLVQNPFISSRKFRVDVFSWLCLITVGIASFRVHLANNPSPYKT